MESIDGISLAVGGTAIGAICTLIGTIIKARYSRTQIEPSPLPVEVQRSYVTQSAFDSAQKENFHAHSNLFDRMKKVEADVGRLTGILETMSEDLRDIKNFLLCQAIKGKDEKKND